jgi:hypothetical protein
MNKQESLQQALHVIAARAGIEQPVFHLTSVSRDAAGVFILQTAWPEGKGMCNVVARAVHGFPRDPFTSCIPLLPELVDEIIRAANGEGVRVDDGDAQDPVEGDRRDDYNEEGDRSGTVSFAFRSISR